MDGVEPHPDPLRSAAGLAAHALMCAIEESGFPLNLILIVVDEDDDTLAIESAGFDRPDDVFKWMALAVEYMRENAPMDVTRQAP